jgi:hypothetical protein
MACYVNITTFEQNSAGANPTAVTRGYDLVVRGTANPDTNNMSGSFTFGGVTTAINIITGAPAEKGQPKPAYGMNWYAVIPMALFADTHYHAGTIQIVRADATGNCHAYAMITVP